MADTDRINENRAGGDKPRDENGNNGNADDPTEEFTIESIRELDVYGPSVEEWIPLVNR